MDVHVEIPGQFAHGLDTIRVAPAKDQDFAGVLRLAGHRPIEILVGAWRPDSDVHSQRAIPGNTGLGVRQIQVEVSGDPTGGALKDVGIAQRYSDEAARSAKLGSMLWTKAQSAGVADDDIRTEVIDDPLKMFFPEPYGAIGAAPVRLSIRVKGLTTIISVEFKYLSACAAQTEHHVHHEISRSTPVAPDVKSSDWLAGGSKAHLKEPPLVGLYRK
jgi:hypothetical protein